MNNKNKQKIRVDLVNWSGHELDGKLEDSILRLQEVIKNNPTCFEFKMEIESESGYYGSCSTNINIWAYRWETDEEFEARLAAAKKSDELAKIEAKRKLQSQEKRERSLYESLKKKFEKEIEETNPKQLK